MLPPSTTARTINLSFLSLLLLITLNLNPTTVSSFVPSFEFTPASYAKHDNSEDFIKSTYNHVEKPHPLQTEYYRFGDTTPFPRDSYGAAAHHHYQQRSRPRRNRKSSVIRSMIRETTIRPSNLICPLFIHEDDEKQHSISSMPGVKRHALPHMMQEIEECVKHGVKSFVLFPKIADNLKSNFGFESYNPEGLIPRAIRMIKDRWGGEVVVITDVALDPYSNQGHDGVVVDGKIVNDITVNQLCSQALSHAYAGADIVSPSDMMDGRIGAIRDALDSRGYTSVSILAYTAKYASAFYGPFRDALDSHPGFGDKKTYQQDPANGREALIEAALDAAEGADMLMVKPGTPYLDVIHNLRLNSKLPIAAYQVSGEYCMIKAAVERGWLDEKEAVMETLIGFRRAGAEVILTYYAKQAAIWMKEERE